MITGNNGKIDREYQKRYSSVLKFNIKMNGIPTSVTLRKDLVSLWVLLTDDIDGEGKLMIQDFIHERVLPVWEKRHGRGLSEFISQCMLRSVLSRKDYNVYKKIHKSL